MRHVLALLFLFTSFIACNQDNKPGNDDLERQEEVPSPKAPNDLELDRDVMDTDEMDLKD